MGYATSLRAMFPDVSLQVEDLLLLETFQLKNLPTRALPMELATLVRTYPFVYRFLVAKWAGISSFLERILDEHEASRDPDLVEEHCQEALWEIADLIIYNKYPERYDSDTPIQWEVSEMTSIASLNAKIVADVGAGSGRIAFKIAPLAQTVYAVEPVSSLRSFMKEKAAKNEVKNLFVMDGTLDAISLPDHSLDVLITSNAIGWNLEAELQEIERVVRPGGQALHLLWSKEEYENPYHQVLCSPPWEYVCSGNPKSLPIKLIYSKTL